MTRCSKNFNWQCLLLQPLLGLVPRAFIQRMYRLQYNARKNGLVGIVLKLRQNPGGSNQIVEQVISMTYTNIDAGSTHSFASVQ